MVTDLLELVRYATSECVLQHMGSRRILRDTRFLTHQLRFTFHLKRSSLMIISKKLLPELPVLHQGSPTVLHKTPHPRKCSGHFVYKTLLCTSKQCIFQETIFFALGRPIGQTGKTGNLESRIGDFALHGVLQQYNACYLISNLYKFC